MPISAQTPVQKIVPRIRPASKFLPLTRPQWEKYSAYLENIKHIEHDLCSSVMAGCVGVRQDLLDKAAKVSDIHHRVCKALHAKMQSDEELKEMMVRPLKNLPVTMANALSSPFCMRTVRVDFFVDEENEKVWLVEVNSGGAGLTDFLRYRKFLKNYYSFDPPSGFDSLDIPSMLTGLIEYCRERKPSAKTLGFVAVDNGEDDHVCDFLDYSRWLKENTDFNPVLLELNNGALSIYEHKNLPSPIADIGDLDAVFVDWFEDLPCLERVQKQRKENNILPVPPRSDVLFENKHFLSVLQRIEKPDTVTDEEWDLLQSTLIPSFPLEEYENHLDEMADWEGVVLKMDIDSGGENVTILRHAERSESAAADERSRSISQGNDNVSFIKTVKKLSEKLTNQNKTGATWTVQEFKKPPFVKLMEPPQKWIEYDYAVHKFDLMTYLAYTNNGKHILFGSRQFEREKIDAVTPEGQEDGFMTPVCGL